MLAKKISVKKFSMFRNKKSQALIRSLAYKGELFFAGLLILFFLYQGYNLAKGSTSNTYYLANDLSIATETMEALSSEKAVFNYSENLKDYKVSFTDSVEVENINGVEKNRAATARKMGLEYSKYISPEALSIVKVGEKVAVFSARTETDDLFLSEGAAKNVFVLEEKGAVAYTSG